MSPPEPRRSPRLVEKKVSLHMSEAPPPPLASAPCGEESKSETPTVLSKYFNMFAPVILIGAGCLHAVIQEQLMHDLSHVPLLITSFEFGCCAVLSLIMLMVRRDDPFNAPRLSLLRISLLVLASLVSGNVALKYVSYPVKVVVKSCKLLPTMALGSLLLRKRYSRHDQLAALLLCAGLVGFTFADRHAGGKSSAVGGLAAPSSLLGTGVLLFAVFCDAVQVLLSERMLRSAPHLTPAHVMMHTNGFAFVAVVLGMLATGEVDVVPWATLPWVRLVVYGACSWVGVCCFIALTRSWGATAAVVATNARKLLTVVFSFVLFPKPFSAMYALSGVAVVAGVGMHSYSRRVAKAQAAKALQKVE